MLAAVYARKSTDQNVADDARSVTRQVEQAREFAARHGWTVAEEHVYDADDGVSGAEFVKREGLNRLMAAVATRPAPPFSVLIIMEESRLGREQGETFAIVRRITEAGVRIFCYLTGQERRLDTPTEKFMLSAANYVSEMERDLARVRTRAAMRAKAARGFVAGGRVYAYRNVTIENGGRRSHVELAIEPTEAEVVRRIFREAALGRGLLRIAKGLNADGIPGPTGRAWATSGVREMLYRERYRGRLVYGKARWVDKGGTKKKVDVPPDDWIRVDAPQLQVIDDAMWKAAHDRLAETRAAYLRGTSGYFWGKPERGQESRYLLTGFLTCATCGGGMQATTRTGRGGVKRYYICTTHRHRGDVGCPSTMSISLPQLEETVVGRLMEDVLTPRVIERVVQALAERLRGESTPLALRRTALERELRELDRERANLTAGIAQAGALPALLEALAEKDQRRTTVGAALDAMDRQTAATASVGPDGLAEDVVGRLRDWRETLRRQPEAARQILRRLLKGRIRVETTAGGVRLQGVTTYGRLLTGCVHSVVPPDGHDELYTVPVCGLVRAAA